MSLRARALDELDALLDRSPAVQEARLAELRVQDPDLAAEVARLLQAESTADDGISRLVQRAAQDLDLPKELGLYRILREIGRGGMGVVYEAEQVRPRRRVALKTLPVLGVTPDARARFEVEVQALAQVQHPGIPQVYEVFEHDGRPIVAMELVEGERLDRALDGVDPVRAARVLERVADAIAYVHDRGVVHRDLKPANVLVGAGDQPKVLDFGIAALEEAGTGAAGTPRYMAPEQRAGRPHDARVDVYALGVMAGELLAESKLRPADLAALLARATAEDPAARTPTAAALAEDLRRWRRLQPLRSVPTPATRRIGLLLRRAPLTVGLGAVAAVLGIGALVALGTSAVSAWDARRLEDLRQEAREQAAADRLLALQQWEAEAGPEAPALAETFRRLVGDPALSGTAAVSDAWTWWADREPDARRRIGALGQAWVHATGPEQVRRTRVALAEEAWDVGRWNALVPLSEGFEDDLPREIVQGAALLRGDLPAVEAQLPADARPLAVLLRDGRWERRDWSARLVVGSTWLRAEPGILHVGDAPGQDALRLEMPAGRVWLVDEGDAVMVRTPGHQARFQPGTGQTALDFVPGGGPQDPRARGVLADGTPFTATSTREGLVVEWARSGVTERHRLTPDQVGRGHLSQPEVVDVDQDGTDEVLLPTHGWRHGGLQVWDLDGGTPDLIHHRPFVPYRVRPLSTGPARVVVSEAPPGTTPRPFLPHLGPPVRTVRVLRWDGGGWTTEAELFSRSRLSGLQLGDLDGDGVDDLVIGCQDLVAVLRGLDDGTFSAPLVLPDLHSPLLVQADDDPALELWVEGNHSPGALLGVAGAGPLPAPPVPPLPELEPPPADGSGSAMLRWERVSELVRIGLVREAVHGLEDLGREPAPMGVRALRQALARLGLHLTRLELAGASAVSEHTFNADPRAAAEQAQALSEAADPLRAAVGHGRLGQPERADLSALDVTELARLLRDEPDLWLPTVRARRPALWARALGFGLAGPERVHDPIVQQSLRMPLLLGLDPRDPDERRLLRIGVSGLLDRGDGIAALDLLDRVPDDVGDPAVWRLRARLYAIAGDGESTLGAIARWRALARPAFEVDEVLRDDPVLAPYAVAAPYGSDAPP